MSRRATLSRSHRSAPPSPSSGSKLGRWALIAGVCMLFAIVAAIVAIAVSPESTSRLRLKAETASREGRVDEALRTWHTINQTADADSESLLGEARAALGLGRAAHAERILEQASARDPTNPEPWLIRLEICRVENRPTDALLLGKRASASVRPTDQRLVLRGLTLALLADAPDDLARATLNRWLQADPQDLSARAALARRMAEFPRSGDPPVGDRLREFEALVRKYPENLNVREAYVILLAEAGDPARGREVLDAWPRPQRDARYYRLRGRWDLEYDQNAAAAVDSLERALEALPHDTKTRYRLARALQAAGRVDRARQVAADVARMREVLDPVQLGRRLDSDLARLEDAAARFDLAELCQSVALVNVASAWRLDAEQGPDSQDHRQAAP